MKNKVVLIQPKNTLALNIYPPLNLILIGTSLQQKGYQVKIITCPTAENYMDQILRECKDSLFAGISVLTPEVPNAIKIAEQVKQNHNVPIVWGGWHSTLFPDQMAKSPLVDKVIVDEGDISILQIADELSNNGYKGSGNNKIVENTQKIDMEQLPCPDYKLIPQIESYINSALADKFLEYDKRKVRWLPYQSSRGCPGKCRFCINVVTDNRKYRHKSAEKVVQEIETIVRSHNVNHLKIVDDNLFVNVEWLKKISRLLIDKSLGITWDAECRVN
ncbi:MAG: B12-binding domain-containing radical SAM protein, partial [Planctomycetota bacterium]